MPSTAQVASSSTKKKKSKKDKKRKREEDGSTSPITNNSSKNRASSSKKKKKRERKSRGEDLIGGESVLRSNVMLADQEHQASSNFQEISSSPAACQISHTTQTTSARAGSIFSLVATPPTASDSSKLHKSPYQIKTILGTAALLPASLPDIPKCIQTSLHSLLLMYNANMGGVLMSLEEGVKLLPIDHKVTGGNSASRNNIRGSGLVGGSIVDDLPYIHYRFQVKGLLFCPALGMKLTGKVVECTSTFITLTTHHILSTKISTAKLHEQGFFYNSGTLEWTRERDGLSNNFAREEDGGEEEDCDAILGPSTSIYLDDVVEFVIERIHECGGYISLDGTRPSVSTLS